jgi:endoglucanase
MKRNVCMSRSFNKLWAAGILVLLVICTSVFWIQPVASFIANAGKETASAHPAAPRLTFHQYADGPYTVQGNQIIGADGTPYIFHGIGLDGFEFNCIGDGFTDPAHLAFLGPGNSSSSGTYWFANTVRLPLSETLWLHGSTSQSCSAAQYQLYVKKTVDALTAMHMNVIIALMWSDAGGQAPAAGWEMPDADSVTFWKQVAPVYASYSNVLFELYNEPHPASPSVANPYQCWQSGCQVTGDKTIGNTPYTYTAVGMQALVNAVRGTNANNLILVAGINWGYDLSHLSQYPITGSNIVYDTHPYPYSQKNMPSEWDTAFGYLTSTYPVMSAEFGEYDCGYSFVSMAVSYFDAHGMGWIGWSWYVTGANGCGYPQLISNYQGTPLASMGSFIRQKLLNYASGPALPMPTGPVNTTWYFAEGRVGGNFREFLSLENPTTSSCQVSITYLAQPDSGTAFTKTVSVSVPANTRVEETVNTDLGLPSNGSGRGISDSAIVSVDTASTPNCTGIVAERPMYFNFNYLGTVVNSGSDVIGMTKLGTSFYFGDMAVGAQAGGSYASFITILNPPNSPTATVTATYYAGGKSVGQQAVTVPGGTRGTIYPNRASPALPSRVAVIVTSSQPIAVERPTYFDNISSGNAGVVSGAADVIGVQALSNDWLFAEGYTGAGFQENLAIANVDPGNTTASVTVTLDLSGGGTQTSTFNVAADSQYIFNVNALAGGQSVSAEVISTGAKIVAEREMFFHYAHNANGRSLSATGGTDVLGQAGPAAQNNYSFAEGYVNVGYDEWLTIQNPTTGTEVITVGLVNAKGEIYVFQLNVGAHTRATVDITGTVIQHLYLPADGFAGYEVAMVVQSSSGPFVAERPMYWNTSGTQGGTATIGYIGG